MLASFLRLLPLPFSFHPPPPAPFLTAQPRPVLALRAPPQRAPLAQCAHSVSSGPLTLPASGPAPAPAGSVSTWWAEETNTDPFFTLTGTLSCRCPLAGLTTPLATCTNKSSGFHPNTPDQLPLDLPRAISQVKSAISASQTDFPPPNFVYIVPPPWTAFPASLPSGF